MSMPFESVNVVSPPVKPAARRFQISIKSIMIATAGVGIIVAGCLAPPVAAIALLTIHAALIACSIIAAISGRGWIRPFAMTFGLYLIGFAFFLVAMRLPGPEAVAIIEIVNLVVATAVGFLAAMFHGFLARRNGLIPVPNVPILRRWLVNDVSPAQIDD